ncbi:Zinc finger protein 250 [Papilio machaon]|uniref:Zinc finger protein 250 n=1 Tax=Papilio machaon TaxID=76193 RepID=A0A0N0PDJ0_PAPMA|nr:zinc finger protein OZF [Papilio machaon]KPJ15702.1 Zinc finger protein 250 [Papilio machaon]
MDLNLCRVCLDKSATISVFSKQNDIQYSAKIMRCVNINISEEDGLPSMLCSNCVAELAVCYQFVQKCEASDKTLRSLSNDYFSEIQTKIKVEVKLENVEEVNEFDHDYDLSDAASEHLQNIEKKKGKRKERKKLFKKNVRRTKAAPIQCVICGLLVISPSAMQNHMRIHTGEKPFDCSFCEAKFRTKGAMKRHVDTYHCKRERKFTCETCGNSFFRKNDIITHMRVHSGERPYVCPFCSQRFRQAASLIRHKRTHTGEKPYSCPICDKKFGDKNLVRKHQSVHSDERNFSCHLCNKCMKSKTALNAHLNLHTNEKQNICSFCGMAFAMKGNLQTHIRRVHSEKSGQCNICLKTFSNLEVHMRKHTGEKPFTCGLCNAAFGVKRSLAHHIMFKHENAEKFKCSIGECTKTFPTATMLEFHLLKQHTNHTPYICQYCSRGFFRTSDLSRHLRVSHIDSQIKPISLKPLVAKPCTLQYSVPNVM